MAKELSVNKNTQEIYEFYKTKLIDPKSLKGKNVLVLELGNITYIDEIKKYAKNVCVIDRAYNCFFGDVFENINTLENQIKSFLEKPKMPKFDLAIMNPPYDNTLHLKIMETVLKNVNEIINISPITEIVSLTTTKTNTEFLNGNLKNIDSILAVEAQKIFAPARINQDLGIYHIIKNCGGTINDFNKFVLRGLNPKTQNIWDKIIAKTDVNFSDYITSPNKKMEKYSVVFNHMSGLTASHNCVYINGKNADGNTYKDNVKNQHKNETTDHFEFNTFEEAENFRLYLNTPIIKFIQFLLSYCGRLSMKAFPYMKNYKKKYNCKFLCSYFGITGYINDDQAVKGSEWEIILKAIK